MTVAVNAVIAGAAVDGAGSSVSYADSEAVFLVPDLEATPTSFEVVLDTCGGEADSEGLPVVSSATYADDEGNMPDMDSIVADGGVLPACEDGKQATQHSTT